MKAIAFTKYGSPDAIKLREVEKPPLQEHQLLIEVHAASINALDQHTLNSKPALMRIISGNGLFKPKDQRLGADIAGRVEAVGANVTQFRPGDEVFGVCTDGGFAEYTCARDKAVVLKPATLTFETVASIPIAALTALQGLRDKGQIQPGQKVLIDGASGGVGTFAVQIAKVFGAEVTATCSTRNVEMVRSIGADHVIDYAKEDFTRNGQRYDLIFVVNGYHPIFSYRRALSPKGIYVMAGGPTAHLFQAILQAFLLGPLLSKTEGQKMGFMGVAKINQKDLEYMKELLEAGKVKPVIDRTYTLSETTEAFRYLEEKHAQGKVVITMEHNNK